MGEHGTTRRTRKRHAPWPRNGLPMQRSRGDVRPESRVGKFRMHMARAPRVAPRPARPSGWIAPVPPATAPGAPLHLGPPTRSPGARAGARAIRKRMLWWRSAGGVAHRRCRVRAIPWGNSPRRRMTRTAIATMAHARDARDDHEGGDEGDRRPIRPGLGPGGQELSGDALAAKIDQRILASPTGPDNATSAPAAKSAPPRATHGTSTGHRAPSRGFPNHRTGRAGNHPADPAYHARRHYGDGVAAPSGDLEGPSTRARGNALCWSS